MEDQSRNLILATALSFLLILVWFVLFPPEDQVPPQDPAAQTQAPDAATGGDLAVAPPSAEGGAALEPAATREDAIARSERVAIETPRLSGSISLTGGRIDDLSLTGYRVSIDDDSPNVTLLSPAGAPQAYYALFGWSPAGDLPDDAVPDANTPWELEDGERLTPETPVTLAWDNGAGLVFRRTISIDEDYMFTVTQSVENQTDAAVRLYPYGIIARQGVPADFQNFFVSHEGVTAVTDGTLEQIKYNNIPDLDPGQQPGTVQETIPVEQEGWIGFADKYWMTSIIPNEGQPFTAVALYNAGTDIYQTEARMPTVTAEPGQVTEATTRLFSGAKEWETIRAYQNEGGIDRFIDAIDWGWFYFLTKPMFWLLHNLNQLIGNMGLAIIALTLLLKAVLFPLAFRSYVSMARMRELQPEMEKLKERAGDDRQKMQEGMMELYKKNKVNPASGCLPILLQIPIFFSLYKVIFVTLELRQAPFFGWLRDLSLPDPSSLYNLFGLLPWGAPEPGTILALVFIGALPILLGISMWLQQKLNPAPPDPTQAMIFAYMPWVFMFMLGGFASGLLVYWITNNTLTFIQQYLIMRSHGSKPDVFGNIRKSFGRKKASEKK
ncbi:membrane protein insertase YidC [Rhodobacterales bacterium HKCCE2091]|nr:membrane protein insertase YidC [Rhodobacterales bacterium HKCCE2091]